MIAALVVSEPINAELADTGRKCKIYSAKDAEVPTLLREAMLTRGEHTVAACIHIDDETISSYAPITEIVRMPNGVCIFEEMPDVVGNFRSTQTNITYMTVAPAGCPKQSYANYSRSDVSAAQFFEIWKYLHALALGEAKFDSSFHASLLANIKKSERATSMFVELRELFTDRSNNNRLSIRSVTTECGRRRNRRGDGFRRLNKCGYEIRFMIGKEVGDDNLWGFTWQAHLQGMLKSLKITNFGDVKY